MKAAGLKVLILLAIAPFSCAHGEPKDVDGENAAATVTPALIGADGPAFTQVNDVQTNLGLSGNKVKICIIDDAFDYTHPNFGTCKRVGWPKPPDCRVYFGYDGATGSDDVRPKLEQGREHGTHVAGIALGGFPDKLLTERGKPLPYQTGVAYRALLGAFKASDDKPDGSAINSQYLNKCADKLQEADCDIMNLSWGYSWRGAAFPVLNDYVVKTIRQYDIVTTTSAGNNGYTTSGTSQQAAPTLFSVYSPGAYEYMIAVAHLNNTASPGALVKISKAIKTADGPRRELVASQRSDTQASICNPSCKGLNLPLQLMPFTDLRLPAPAGAIICGLRAVRPGGEADVAGQALVLQLTDECQAQLPALLSYFILPLRPKLLLLVVPAGSERYDSATAGDNEQLPVLWLTPDDGVALMSALAEDPSIALEDLPGAVEVPVPDEWAKQPARQSSMGPGWNLGIKPDIAAPGTLYSSVPDGKYQTWPGTSMASPYMAGVFAMWREHMRNKGKGKPNRGWLVEAHKVFKLTAKPIKYPGSDLMWPPAKVGLGMVQAQSAMMNKVFVAPNELFMRTDKATQGFKLVLTNQGTKCVAYKIVHKPALGLNLVKAWYRNAFDLSAPTAWVTVNEGKGDVVVVPGKGKATVKVALALPNRLRSLSVIVSGYIVFEPRATADCPDTIRLGDEAGFGVPAKGNEARLGATTAHVTAEAGLLQVGSTVNTTDPSNSISDDASGSVQSLGNDVFNWVPMADKRVDVPSVTVVYQGSSKSWSTLGQPDSLALFPPLLEGLPGADDATAALSQGPAYTCSTARKFTDEQFQSAFRCEVPTSDLEFTVAGSASIRYLNFGVALLRPVARMRIQVATETGETVGTSKDFGPCPASLPASVTAVPYDCTDGRQMFNGTSLFFEDVKGTTPIDLTAGKAYKLSLLMTPIVALGDKQVGIKVPNTPFSVEPAYGLVKIVEAGP